MATSTSHLPVLRLVAATALLTVLSALPGVASDEIQQIRDIYATVNAKADSLREVQTKFADASGETNLTGCLEGQDVLKIIVQRQGRKGTEEIYLNKGEPVFLYTRYHRSPGAADSVPPVVEERIYLKDGKIIRWLSNDPSFVPHAEDEQGMTEQISTETPKFVRALRDAAGQNSR